MRLIILLGLEVYKAEIIKAVIRESLRRKLDKVYFKEIEEWQKYYREQKFAKKLDKNMRKEIELFQKELEKWKPDELKDFIIEGLDCLKK